uniref:Vacuolar protein sorting-associated protein VTA1 n=1 Tax=Globodera pallida TaxID=36090 RepID=A0A183CCF2_GLOPA
MSTAINLSDIPQSMRPIAHFVKIANEYAARDVVIHYWCLVKSLEDGMKQSGNDPDTKKFLLNLMTVLENMKQMHKNNDAITQEIVAQSHIEDQAQRLFQFAYGLDQQGDFGQKIIKAFYTAGYLFDVLTCFGQLDENIQSARKYAKWRAIDIHNCLKRGEQPKPAEDQQMMQRAKDSDDQDDIAAQINDKLSAELNDLNASLTQTQPSSVNQQQFYSVPTHPSQQRQIPSPYGPSGAVQYPAGTGSFGGVNPQGGAAHHPQQQSHRLPISGLQEPFRGTSLAGVSPNVHGHGSPTHQGVFSSSPHLHPKSPPTHQQMHADATAHHQASGLTLQDYLEAKKLAKYAQSAMDYEDPKTAIDYLQKSIAVLQKRQQ